MAECNRKSLSFSRLRRQEIVANFDGGRLTSDAGGLLLREVDRRLGLTAGLAERIAARVAVSVRRIVFHLSSYCPYQQLFAVLVRRLTPI